MNKQPKRHTTQEASNNLKGRYNLVTALAMIVGIVIGSGIFFKADNVLSYTGGNVVLGIIVFVLAALAIIFGSLSIAELAKRSDRHGGLIGYADEFVSPHFSTMIGWFQLFLYYPALGVVVTWVVGIYTALLFGVKAASLELQMTIGMGWFVICFAFNIFSAAFAGKFQVFSTIVKLIPLFVLGVMAFLFGEPIKLLTQPTPQALQATHTLAWLGAVGPIAFAFDGWVVSTSISGEIKNAQRNLPSALIIAPLVILCGYLLYFIGITSYLGTAQVMALGDDSVNVVARNLFGETAAKAFLVFVVISVMGTVNGLILGLIRLPYSLALDQRLPMSAWFSQVSPRYQLSIPSAILGFLLSLFWAVVHYAVMKYQLLGVMDISEIAIVVSYLLYVVFYYVVFRLWRQGEINSVLFGCIAPLLGTLGSLFVLYGGSQNPLFLPVCLPICVVVLIAAYVYSHTIPSQKS